MTMVEYKKALAEKIPLPSTLQQEKLMRLVMKINQELDQYGRAQFTCGHRDGSRTTVCSMGRNIKKMYEEKGYIVSLYEYALSNRSDYFCITIEL